MNYIEGLTKEEKIALCEIVSGERFKELFKSNEKEFSKIVNGFRAKGLTDTLALNFAITNVDKPFVSGFINFMVEQWLNKIEADTDNFECENMEHKEALASALLDSEFAEDVDLYLKISGLSLSERERIQLSESMKRIRHEREKDAETAERIKAIEDEKNRLAEQLESAQKGIDALKSDYEQKLGQAQEEKSSLEVALTEARKQISEMQAVPEQEASSEREQLARYDDTIPSAIPSIHSEETVSLCSATTDYNDQKRLIRCADLTHDGCYHIFRSNTEVSPYFDNRDWLYYKDGPTDDGFYGIWTWIAEKNWNDPSKDYVISQYNVNIVPIEIVVINGADLDELINLLKDGIDYKPFSKRVMFSVYISNRQYIGILCNVRDLVLSDGKACFSDKLTEVPVYEFSNSDILRLDTGLSFYAKAFAGVPSRLYALKNPLEVVNDIVQSSISWNAYKLRGFRNVEYKSFKDFIDTIPVDDVVEKIKEACHCSKLVAEEHLKEFVDRAWKYVDGNSLEDEILLSAISTSSELQDRTKDLIKSDWESENNALLSKAQEELNLLDSQIKNKNAELAEVQESYKKLKVEEKSISESIAEKKKLADDVEAAVSERIEKAKNNTADFIAEIAFVGGQKTSVRESYSNLKETQYHVVDAFSDLSNLEPHSNWKDVLDTIEFELTKAGVADKYREGLATFLCSAYIHKQPILLVGPNASDIAEAFSTSVTASKHGVLSCDGAYSTQTIREIGKAGESIVVINNLLTGDWMNRLPEILSNKDVFYIATHPYSEDVRVEPKSLYGYMLPLFTEFFADRKATGKYNGGYFADDFENFEDDSSKKPRNILKLPAECAVSALIKNSLNTILSTMHEMDSQINSDDDFMFSVLQIAYATLEPSEVAEIISASSISFSLTHDLQYLLEDNS
ncbi:MAG: hypothetical protein LUC38_05580 [Oscillospiraceae bacterium]|nr:hypothetical protein [Oscillospiraceae bacterium]